MIPAAIRRRLAGWLRLAAHRIYREPLHTITVTTAEETRTFINCIDAQRWEW